MFHIHILRRPYNERYQTGGNREKKLRTYGLFKTVFKQEKYITVLKNPHIRHCYAKFRRSAHDCQKWNTRNKQTNKLCLFFFNFGEDISYFGILRYKLRDLKKIYDDFVIDPIKKGIFRRLLVLLFQIGRKSLVKYKWLWLYTTRKNLPGLSFMLNNQTV